MRAWRILPTLLLFASASLLHVPATFADPLHRVGNDGEWRHHGSGWVYPRQIGGLQRVGAPYSMDGNDDVGARYAAVFEGMRRSAVVDVYHNDSAASGARLDTARHASGNSDIRATTGIASEAPFEIRSSPELTAVKIAYAPDATTQGQQASLYFVQTSEWVITVRTIAQANDEQAPATLDAFVRALPWQTLGTDFDSPLPTGS